MSRHLVCAMTLCALVAACGQSQPVSLSVAPKDIADADIPLVTDALRAFLAACPEMGRLSGDIEQATLSWGYGDNPEFLERGWRKPVELIVKFRDSPSDKRLAEWRTMGQMCYYTMGGGLRPGWSTGKEACSLVCGVARNDPAWIAPPFEQLFASVPEFKFLDDPAAPDYQQAVMRAKAEWEAEIAKETAAAKKGETDAISNVGYLWQHGALGIPGDPYQACVWRTVHYLKTAPEVDVNLVPSRERRREMEASFVEGYRAEAHGACTRRDLSPDRRVAAMEEANRIAASLPGRRFERADVLAD